MGRRDRLGCGGWAGREGHGYTHREKLRKVLGKNPKLLTAIALVGEPGG